MPGQNDSQYVPALGYRLLTPFYDAVVGATTRENTFKRSLIEQADMLGGQSVLDLACGTGTLSIWIKQGHPDCEVIGVDGDPTVLSLASRKALKNSVTVQFDEALSQALPYPDARFDHVVSSLFFHHLSWEDKERTVHEVLRVLRPGGQLHVADWGKSKNVVMRGLFLSIQMLDGFKNTQVNVDGKLVDLFKYAGFVDVSQNRTFGTIFGTMALYSARKPSRPVVVAGR